MGTSTIVANITMRVLLDNGIFSHSEFAESAVKETLVGWGDTKQVLPVHGLIRKTPDKNPEFQKQKEALFTVGRLIREGVIEAYDYREIQCERIRGRIGLRVCDALQGCTFHSCRPAVERSKFRQTVNFMDAISKGGKKDCAAGLELSEANQIPFFEWLCNLEKEHIDALIRHGALIDLTAFEIESLRNVDWFRVLCQTSGSRENSRENYPDVFHLWTAERNGLDAVLTLDGKLKNLVSRVKKEKVKRVEIRTEVLLPMDLLQKLGITEPDPVPMDIDRFYRWHELPE